MTDEQKEIKKWSNEQKVEALAKFVALRSGDPRKALLYGFMLDCLLDEINKGQVKIEKLKNQNKLASEEHEKRFNEFETEIEKKDKVIDELASRVYLNKQEIEEMEKDIYNNPNHKGFADFVKRYFERKVKNENRNN